MLQLSGNGSQNTRARQGSNATRLNWKFLKMGKIKLIVILLALLVFFIFTVLLIVNLRGISDRLDDMEKTINKTDQLWLEREQGKRKNRDKFPTNRPSST